MQSTVTRQPVPAKNIEMVSTARYHFETVTHCEMCGDPVQSHKVMGQRLNKSQGVSPKKKTGISVSVLRCSKCDLIYSQPMPVPFDIQDHYGTPPENYWTKSYFTINPQYFAREISIVKNLLNFKAGMKSLDIGAGLGKSMISLKAAGFDAYGIEPSIPFRDRAISKMGIDSAKLKLGMVEEMEYPENSFDFISFSAVFEHLYHPAEALEKALTWLKPNGVIHIEVPSSKHLMARLVNLYYRIIGTNYVSNISPMHNPFHMYEFGLRSFEQLSKKLNFKIAEHQYDVCEIAFVPKFLHPLLNKYMQATKTGMQLTVYLKK